MEEVSAWELDQQVISGVRLMAERADLGFAVRVFTACRASAGRAARIATAGAGIAIVAAVATNLQVSDNAPITRRRAISDWRELDASTIAAAITAAAVDNSLALRRVSPTLAGQRVEQLLRDAAA